MRARLTFAIVAVSVTVAGAQNLTPKHRLEGSYYWQTKTAEQVAADKEFLKGAYDEKTPGLRLPMVIREFKPTYTTEAMREKLQGSVTVQIVIGEDGKVARARVLESFDRVFGLDQAAIDAAKRWTFQPGTLNGKPVTVAVILVLEFRLH